MTIGQAWHFGCAHEVVPVVRPRATAIDRANHRELTVPHMLADAFEFVVPGPEAFEAGAKYLLARGYR